MKKIVLLFFCLLFLLTACTQSDTTSKAPSDAVSDNADSSAALSGEEDIDSPLAFHEISDDRMTTVGTQKTFRDVGIAVSVPADWSCMELNGEDGSIFSFRHPELGEKCQFLFYLTGSEFLKERTEEEYLAYLSEADYKDVSITTFAKEKVDGYEGTKVVFSYSSENAEWIQINYDNVVVGFRLYNFKITYPASDSETLKPVLESVWDSVEFTTDT